MAKLISKSMNKARYITLLFLQIKSLIIFDKAITHKRTTDMMMLRKGFQGIEDTELIYSLAIKRSQMFLVVIYISKVINKTAMKFIATIEIFK